MAFTRNPSDTNVSPATYTADGASDILLVDQQRDIAIDGSGKGDLVAVTAAALASNALYDYNVRGLAGNDEIAVVATLVQDSTFNGNEGNDDLAVGDFGLLGTIFTNSYLLGGKGDDTLFGYDVSGGEINGNIGDDTINLLNTTTGFNQYVGGGQGNDAITVEGQFTNSIIDGNKGIDTIIIEDGTHSGTSVNGGEGGDIIRSSGDLSKGLRLDGNKGNDTIVSEGALGSTIFGGEGNDTLVSSSVAGETSTIDAGIGADFVLTDSSAAKETVVFDSGDSVAATASALGNVPGAAISGTITFGNNVDVITGITGGGVVGATNDLIDIDFKPAEFVLANGLANTATLRTDTVYAVQGDFAGKVFTVGTAATDDDYIYVVGGNNLTLGQVFTNSTNMFVSNSLIATGQFV